MLAFFRPAPRPGVKRHMNRAAALLLLLLLLLSVQNTAYFGQLC